MNAMNQIMHQAAITTEFPDSVLSISWKDDNSSMYAGT
jgi:hypothetical protein